MFKRHNGLDTILHMLTTVDESKYSRGDTKFCCDRPGEYVYPLRVIYAFLSAVRNLLGVIKDEDFAGKFVPALNKALLKRFTECRRTDFEEIDLIGEKLFFDLADAFLGREKLSSYPIRQAKEKLSCSFWLDSSDSKIKLKGLSLLRDKLQIPEIRISSPS